MAKLEANIAEMKEKRCGRFRTETTLAFARECSIEESWGEDQLNLLKEKIIEAKKLRYETNKAQRCGPCLA